MTVFPGSNWILILSEGLHAGLRLYGSLYRGQSYAVWKYRLTEDKKKKNRSGRTYPITNCYPMYYNFGSLPSPSPKLIFKPYESDPYRPHVPAALQSSPSLVWLSFGVLFVLIPEQKKSFVSCFPSPNDIRACLIELTDVYDIHKPHDYKLHLCLLCLLLLFVSHELSSGSVWFCWYNHIFKVNELKQ